MRVPVTSAPSGGSTLPGRLVNDRGQGLPDYSVDLLRANGTRVEAVGLTNASGYFTAAFDAARTAALEKDGDLFARVVDLTGKEILRDKSALRFGAGTDLQITLVVPVPVVPKSVVIDGTVIYGVRTTASTSTASTSTGTATNLTPAPTPPPTPEPPKERTSLDKLDIDDAVRKMLSAGGIVDVEGIIEVDPQKLAAIVGSADTAKKLTDMAKRLLGSTAVRTGETTLTAKPSMPPTETTEGKKKKTRKRTAPKKPK
jgi:hypothetical protein